ncbi:hypothetical protein FH972_003241 [Carpinus fangiana]|uniref:DUF4378 domain-containing protein n=1 Tax=Carpinus fangiana TaxID=176857 RepID=A0A5N6QKT1_9ROSI|nr:hypothetical protein FH972_003241 [Carpinus fangiana]
MPQGSLKSAVYRSFVTCDNPKGVVDCNTMRKSRTSSQKMDRRIESRRSTPKNSDTSMEYKAEKEEMQLSKGFKEEVHSPSSFQLMEVSQGVQKLNRMINSWTKGVRFDGQSKDIAEDLLKGALDLQESLIMLGKLQETSQNMTRLETKQNEKSERRRIDEVGIERTQSSEFGDQNCSMRFQKRRLSADGSSRDHIEELRKVIRGSFTRQNLLPNPTIEEMGYLHLKDLDSVSEIRTTSSSQSLMVHPYDFGSTDPALSSRALQKKEKGPNLIAKLMGLEDLPSKPLRAPLQKHLESERILNQRRAVFDIDRPRGRKPFSNADLERRTLKNILETMKFKGLLKSNSVKELKPPQSYHSHSKKRLIDEIPPIVLIKPLIEELQTPVLQEEEALNTKKMLRKVKRKENLPSKTHKEGALSSKKLHRKMEAVEAPTKTLSLEEGNKHKEVVRQPEEKKVISKEKASNKLKATGLVDQKLQKKKATDKKAHKIQNARGKPSEMENVKAKIVSKSEDQARAASTKPRKHENRSNIINNQITRRPSAFQNSISKLTTKTTISSSTDQKKNQMKKMNPVREPIAAKSLIENFGSKEDDKRINLGSGNCSPMIRTDTSLVDQLPIEEDIDASESYIEEHCSNSQSSLSDVIPLSPKHEIDDKTTEEAYNHIIQSRADIKSFKSGTNLEALLLSSPSFLSRAEELFYLNVRNPSGISDLVVANVKLSLECANELIERISLRDSQTIHPLLLASVGNLRVCISIDNLAGEVCKGIENLRSYSNLAGECLPVDGIYAMLERDISCNGVENAIWDVDWRHAFSVDDAEQVVNEIEKLLFDGLIEEVFT